MSSRGRVLPTGWALAKIEDIFAVLPDGRTMHQGWSPQCHDKPAPPEKWGVLKTTAIQPGAFVDRHNKQLPDTLVARPAIEVHAGDILITCAGPRSRCGVPCLVRHTRSLLMLSGKMYRFRAADGVSPALVEAWLLTSEAQVAVDRMKTGGSDSGLNLTHDRFRLLEIVLPPSGEQDRIVDVIESLLPRLDAASASLEAAQRKLKAYRASVLKAAVEGRLVPTEAELARKQGRSYEAAAVLLERILKERRRRWEDTGLAKMKATGTVPKGDRWKEKYREPKPPDIDNLPNLPEGWCWATVEGISTKVVDGVHKKPHYVDGGVPFVSVKNLTAGPGIDFEQVKFVTRDDHQAFIQRTDPEYGDVLVSKDGTLGVVRAVRDHREFSIFVSVALIKPVDRTMTDFIELALSAPQVQAQMVPKGSGLQHIHLEDLRADCVPLAPAAEQERLAEAVQRYLSDAEWLGERIYGQLRRCVRLRQSILTAAFRGCLSEQVSSDEPADSLLYRIRAQRKDARVTRTKPKRSTKVKAAR